MCCKSDFDPECVYTCDGWEIRDLKFVLTGFQGSVSIYLVFHTLISLKVSYILFSFGMQDDDGNEQLLADDTVVPLCCVCCVPGRDSDPRISTVWTSLRVQCGC